MGLELRRGLAPRKHVWRELGPINLEQVPQDVGGTSAMSLDAALLAPSKNRNGRRPTTSCDRPPYETTSKQMRFCTICRASRTQEHYIYIYIDLQALRCLEKKQNALIVVYPKPKTSCVKNGLLSLSFMWNTFCVSRLCFFFKFDPGL